MKINSHSLQGLRDQNEDTHVYFLNLEGQEKKISKINFVGVFDGHGGKIVRHGKNGKFLNRNCIVSPVVHQYDLVTCPSIKK